MGAERERFGRAASLQCYSGIAPVTKQSGDKRHVHRRYLCPKFSKQSFHEYAKEAILCSRWAAAYYGQQRSKGSRHHTAVRALAFKWQRIIWRCWQSRTIYKEEVYEAALRRSGSPLVALLDHIELGKIPRQKPDEENLKNLLPDYLRGELVDRPPAGNARSAARAANKSPAADCPAGRRLASALVQAQSPTISQQNSCP